MATTPISPQAETMIPMLDADGNTGSVPASRVQDAVKGGLKVGIRMVDPDGTTGTIPMHKYPDALKAGFKAAQPAPTSEYEAEDRYEASNPGFLQRVSHAYNQVATGVKGAYDMTIRPVHEAIAEPFRDLSTTDEQAQAQVAAAEAHKKEVYHKASSDFHKAMANNDAGGILDAGKDLLELFTNDYQGANPNDPLANLASSAIRSAEAEHVKSSEHTANVVAAVRDAATRYGYGDKDGALKALSQVLPEASQAIGHGVAAAVPLIGPAAAKAGEDLSGPNPSYGAGEVAGLLAPLALKESGALKEVRTAVTDALPDSIKNPISTLAGKAAGVAGDAAMGVAKAAARKAGQAAPAVAGAAVTLGKEFAGGITDTLTNAVSSKLNDLKSNVAATASDAFQAMDGVRQTVQDQLAKAGVPAAKATAMARELGYRVQDYYNAYTKSVSGGSFDADFETGLKGVVEATIKEDPSIWNKIGSKIGVTYGEPERIPQRPVDEAGKPAQQLGPNTNPKTGDVDAEFKPRTNFSRVAAEEQARGNPSPVWEGGTFGEKVGGAWHSIERVLRTVPTIARGISEGVDAPHMEVARQVIDNAVKSLHPDELSGQGLQKLIHDVHDSAGAVLEGTLKDINDKNPGLKMEVSPRVQNGLKSVSKLFPLAEPAVNDALTNPTLENIAKARGLITEYAGDAGRDGQTALSVGKQLDGEIKAAIEKVDPKAAEDYMAAAKHTSDISGQVGTGVLRRILDADRSEAYDHLLNETPEQFAQTRKRLTTGTPYGPTYASRIEQGMMRRIIESAPAESSGPMKLRSLGMERMLYKNKTKFSPANFERFKDLVGADGYFGTIEKDMQRTSTRGVAAEYGAVTGALGGALAAFISGHPVVGTALAGGTGFALLAHYGAETFARVLMEKNGQIQFSRLAKLVADLHPTSDKVAYAKELTKNIQKGLDKAKSAAGYTPTGQAQQNTH